MLAARLGVQTLAYTFPRVHIITTAIDPKVATPPFHKLCRVTAIYVPAGQ